MNESFRGFLHDEMSGIRSRAHKPRTVLTGPQGARVNVDGREVIMLCSNNYLGLANHPKVKEAALQAVQRYGAGTAAARGLSGSTELHEGLELALARFKGTESALVLNSGYTANVGTISCLMGEGDVILSDEYNHGSIIDGCRLSKADTKVYPHNDTTALKNLLKESQGYRKKLIVTDTVFSMEGSMAPLAEIVELSEKYGAAVMVDDAHGTGVLGESGKGAVEHLGLEGKIDIYLGTLGKALGSIGGYIAGSRDLIEYVSLKARSMLFTTSLPAASIGASISAIQVLQDEPKLRDALWENARYFKGALDGLGFDTLGSVTPIVPVLIGDIGLARATSEELFHAGVYAHVIGYPYVPQNSARLRTIVSALHTKEDLAFALKMLERSGTRLGII